MYDIFEQLDWPIHSDLFFGTNGTLNYDIKDDKKAKELEENRTFVIEDLTFNDVRSHLNDIIGNKKIRGT